MTHSARILHVDDDEANRYAVTRTLVRAGFQVVEAADGTNALRLARDKPDLVILDVRLPDVDGFEVCRRLKSDPLTAAIPVLHLSASRVTSEDKAFGLDGGAEGYLIRPVEPVELVATINALLRARRSEAALAEREQQFKALTDGVRDYAIFALDVQGRIVSWHSGAEHLLGYTAGEALGMPLAKLMPPEQQEENLAAREMAVAAETGEYKADGPRVRRDGSTFDAATVLTATRSSDGVLTGYLKLVQDISARKRHADALQAQLASEQAARAEAERVGRMKDEFLATLGHEIRTPLNAILGWSQVIQGDDVSAEDVAQGIEVIERNARAQAQIVEDLLDMSRIVSGKIRLDMRPLDLVSLVQAAIDTTMPAAGARAVNLWSDSDVPEGDAKAAVLGDANRLQQVYWNLLSNAVKFTPRGGDVSVRIRRVGPLIETSITDTGEGIDTRFLPYVFDRFRQQDASTTRRHGGLGLGLSIVKQLVDLHGGTVRVASPGPGRGTTFTVGLPVVVDRAVVSPHADQTGEAADVGEGVRAARPASASLEGLRVLVVDDEADARGLTRRVLDGFGATVATAASAAAALLVLRGEPIDVLVSDIGMPGEDGYALIRRVREMVPGSPGRDVPAVALTAYARAEDRTLALAAGFQAHVTKPIDSALLVMTVARLAGRG